MTPESLLEIVHYTLLTATKLASPYMISAVVIGVLMNIVQTVTQMKDMSLTFVPKIAGVGVVGLLMMPWSIQVSLNYFHYILELFEGL